MQMAQNGKTGVSPMLRNNLPEIILPPRRIGRGTIAMRVENDVGTLVTLKEV